MTTIQLIVDRLRASVDAVPAPSFLEVSLIGHCNFRCVQCHQLHHIAEDVAGGAPGPKVLDVERVIHLLEEARAIGVQKVALCGRGEPTLHPAAPRVVRAVKRSGLSGVLITNASRLSADLLGALDESAFDEISISLYAIDEAGHAAIARPRGGVSHRDVLTNLAAVRRAAPRTRTTVSILLQRQWLDRLDAAQDLIEALDADAVEIHLTRPYQNAVQHAAGPHDQEMARQLAGAWSRLLASGRKIAPALAEFVTRYLASPSSDSIETTYSRVPCHAGSWAIFVSDDGTVRPCSNSNWVLGDLAAASLREIWEGAEYQRFRSLARSHIIATRTPLPKSYCAHCGWAWFHERLHAALEAEGGDASGHGHRSTGAGPSGHS
jgi:MoaA/NifB/PqqE/SkfB family radical SAM enzyme